MPPKLHTNESTFLENYFEPRGCKLCYTEFDHVHAANTHMFMQLIPICLCY